MRHIRTIRATRAPSHLVGGQLVAEHPLALVSPKVDQDFHGTHVDLPFHGSGAAALRDRRLGREQYALYFFLGFWKFPRVRKKGQGG